MLHPTQRSIRNIVGKNWRLPRKDWHGTSGHYGRLNGLQFGDFLSMLHRQRFAKKMCVSAGT